MKIFLLFWCLLFGHKPVDYWEGMRAPDGPVVPIVFDYTPREPKSREEILENPNEYDVVTKDFKTGEIVQKQNVFDLHLCRRCGMVYWERAK